MVERGRHELSADRSAAASDVLAHFRWVDGDAGTWNMLREAPSLSSIVSELSRLSAMEIPDVIVGIEARGFVFAPMVALALGGLLPETRPIEIAPACDTARKRRSATPDLRSRGCRPVFVRWTSPGKPLGWAWQS